MDADERTICKYLQTCQNQFISIREISKRAAGRKRYQRDPEWAIAPTGRLLDRGVLESDGSNHFRLIPREKPKKPQKWIAPHIRNILERSGNFTEVLQLDEDLMPEVEK